MADVVVFRNMAGRSKYHGSIVQSITELTFRELYISDFLRSSSGWCLEQSNSSTLSCVAMGRVSMVSIGSSFLCYLVCSIVNLFVKPSICSSRYSCALYECVIPAQVLVSCWGVILTISIWFSSWKPMAHVWHYINIFGSISLCVVVVENAGKWMRIRDKLLSFWCGSRRHNCCSKRWMLLKLHSELTHQYAAGDVLVFCESILYTPRLILQLDPYKLMTIPCAWIWHLVKQNKHIDNIVFLLWSSYCTIPHPR